MNFDLPEELKSHLQSIESSINYTILPLQHSEDNNRLFDHRREHHQTDWDNDGNARPEWEALLGQARKLSDEAGLYRFALPKQYGGEEHPHMNAWISAIIHNLALHLTYGGGLGLANDLQNEHSIVGNFPDIFMIHHFGSEEQRRTLIPVRLHGEFRTTFGLTEPDHGSDATFMSTIAHRDRGGFEITGMKK
ncbi:uncharacterized protein N7503_009810 [Penicillium pulvis]|uniref:uncharacterized protein n=1 Tax=Penicillium pulvis TaxID=1562058 RepID=UPI0025486210|nr:uncharacterized protein N7503_009810 [Penicillium pulvis]KAJ5784598.1 hypothetical protein N7503_009810 [Penicillium pulvis]